MKKVFTSKYRSLKTVGVLLVFLLVASCSVSRKGEVPSFYVFHNYSAKYNVGEEDYYLQITQGADSVPSVVLYGTNDFFVNIRNGNSGPVYFVETLSLCKQTNKEWRYLLDPKGVTFFNSALPLNVHSAKDAKKAGYKVVSKDSAYLSPFRFVGIFDEKPTSTEENLALFSITLSKDSVLLWNQQLGKLCFRRITFPKNGDT